MDGFAMLAKHNVSTTWHNQASMSGGTMHNDLPNGKSPHTKTGTNSFECRINATTSFVSCKSGSRDVYVEERQSDELIDCDAMFSPKRQPNILKKKNAPETDPIKSLQFSPSRFLTPVIDCQGDQPCIAEDVNVSTPNKIDDSGFETYCETDEIFSKAVTSTPIGKKLPKQLSSPLKRLKENVSPVAPRFQLSETCISMAAEGDSDCIRRIQSTFDSGSEMIFKTPLIRRFINEIGPKTPSPFKCEHEECLADTTSTAMCYHIDDSYAMLSSHGSLCLSDGLPPTVVNKSENGRLKPQKRARKALKLDMDLSQIERGQKYCCIDTKTPVPSFQTLVSKSAIGMIPFGPALPRNNIRIHSCSSLVDQKTVVQCKTLGVGRKSFCTTHQDFLKKLDGGSKSFELDKKWVAVACGRSEDQRAMTIAAKHYLQSR